MGTRTKTMTWKILLGQSNSYFLHAHTGTFVDLIVLQHCYILANV